MAQSNAPDPSSSVTNLQHNGTTVHLANFFAEDPAFWFRQAESQFQLKGITSSITKLEHVISALDHRTAKNVKDILRETPQKDSYERLKARLLEEFTLSIDERAARLLKFSSSSSDTPTQILNQMMDLLPEGNEPDFLFIEIFLQQLPPPVRCNIRTHDRKDLRALAKLADVYAQDLSLSNINAVRPYSSFERKSRTPSPKSTSSFQRASSQLPLTLCYYHRRWGDKARKCIPPCSFYIQGNGSAGHQ
eukprot:TRINITY_DN3386_c0_g1_i1.p2 TRINITY_DN3386_c0_g1~~TRINITY_DN3386_c0_g1_i1.p2  ORF type:complete len:248 (+),score=10.91 TRINITY_DN3386_c0_g1_i1:1973-2716(+)